MEHPFWGYRRVWAYLRYREGIQINQKKIRQLMKENALMVSQVANKAKRTSKKGKSRANRPCGIGA